MLLNIARTDLMDALMTEAREKDCSPQALIIRILEERYIVRECLNQEETLWID